MWKKRQNEKRTVKPGSFVELLFLNCSTIKPRTKKLKY